MGRKGQARIIEALITVVMVIAVQFMIVGFYQSLSYREPSELEHYAREILNALRERGVFERIGNPTWEYELRTLLDTLMPSYIFYNLTIIGTSGGNVVKVSNIEGLDYTAFSEFYTVRQTYTLSVPSFNETKKRRPVDVILLIDRSGSMNDELPSQPGVTKLEALKDAIVELLNAGIFDPSMDRIGIVTYSTSESPYHNPDRPPDAWDSPPLGHSLTNDTNILQQIVLGKDFKADGGTNMAEGILYAIYNLNGTRGAEPRPEAIKAIVLMTDGVANVDKNREYCGHFDEGLDGYGKAYGGRMYALEMANEAAKQGIKIYTIGFGEKGVEYDFYEEFLKVVKTERYYHARTGEELTNAYKEIAMELTSQYYTDVDIILVELTLAKE
ncbi:hypothetical protein DRO58_05575 [Candidatus Bathyarchaeota archaeon]|nr:MAG: hypothetical protein DRO58_05575 [Candidatus Bathyarchaeota archaeon]